MDKEFGIDVVDSDRLSPIDDYYDTNRILGRFVTSKVERIGAVVHECRAYNRDNDTGRASWCSAAGVAGNFQHWRAEPSCGEFLAGIALRCCLRVFVRR